MKTVNSSIKSDLGKFLVEIAINKIATWAAFEFNQLRNNKQFPICIQTTKNTWAIGNFTVKNLGAQTWPLYHDGKFIHEFYSKQAAMFYAVFETMQMYKIAETLLQSDKDLAYANTDLQLYTKKLSCITRKTDSFKIQLWRSRYLQSKAKFNYAREELEKRLQTAKYNKIWDRIL